MSLGLNIVVGKSGLLDLGYVAFFAIRAYADAILGTRYHMTTREVLPIGMALAMISGVILGLPTLRLRGDYLAIVTLGFGEIVRIVAVNNPGIGGPNGIPAIQVDMSSRYLGVGMVPSNPLDVSGLANVTALNVSNTLSATSLNISGNSRTSNLLVSNTLSSSNVFVSNTLSSSNVYVSNNLIAVNTTIQGPLIANNSVTLTALTQNTSATWYNTSFLSISGNVVSNSPVYRLTTYDNRSNTDVPSNISTRGIGTNLDLKTGGILSLPSNLYTVQTFNPSTYTAIPAPICQIAYGYSNTYIRWSINTNTWSSWQQYGTAGTDQQVIFNATGGDRKSVV